MPVKLTQEEYIKRATEAHRGKYDYSSTVYKNASTKIEIVCPKHGSFFQLPSNHLKHGCIFCGNEQQADTRSLTTDKFKVKATLKHQGKYDYSLVNYQGFNSKIEIVCPDHGSFMQRANNHLAGIGCNKCGRTQSRTAQLKTYIPHKCGYLYPTVDLPLYNNQRTFKCSCGRTTAVSGYSVREGLVKSCGSCTAKPKSYWLSLEWGNLKLNQSEPLKDEWSPQSHQPFKFDCKCGNTTIVRMADVTDGHTQSCGCLTPGKSPFSPVRKVEEHISDLGISFTTDDRSVILPFELDIWIPSSNMGLEFNGQYYHSLDGTESALAKYRHRDKFNLCQQKGILLLQIDEHEWNNPVTQRVWKSIIASKLGKHTTRIPARKTTFQPISSIEANAFLAVNHLQGVTPALRWSFGLFYQDELVGVVSYCGHQHTQINLSRLAFKLDTTIVGGAHKLFKNSLPVLPAGGDIISFSNNQYSDGSIYSILGFTKDKDLPPSYQWYFRGKIWNKRALRKKELEKLLPDFNASETEHANLYRNGARCLYDAGYQRWLYKRQLSTSLSDDKPSSTKTSDFNSHLS